MNLLFINSVQTSPLTPLQCGEWRNGRHSERSEESMRCFGKPQHDGRSFTFVQDDGGACSVLPSPHWRRVGDEVREGLGMRSIPEVLNK